MSGLDWWVFRTPGRGRFQRLVVQCNAYVQAFALESSRWQILRFPDSRPERQMLPFRRPTNVLRQTENASAHPWDQFPIDLHSLSMIERLVVNPMAALRPASTGAN